VTVIAAAWAGRALAAARELVLAATLGTSAAKDALVLAWTLPGLLAALAGESLTPLLVPRVVADSAARWRLRQLLRTAVGRALLAALVGLALGLAWAAPACIHLLAPAASAPTRELAVRLTHLLAVNTVLLVALAGLGALCQAHGRLAVVPLATGASALAVVVALWRATGSPARQVQAAAWGLSLGNALAVLLLIAVVLRAEERPKAAAHHTWSPARGSDGLRTSAALLLLGTLILHAVPLADRRAGAALGDGAIAAYDYAGRLLQFLFNLGVAPFTWSRFSRWSRLLAEGAPRHVLARQVETDLQVLLSGVAPVCVFLALFALPVAGCVYARGHLAASGAVAIARAVRVLALGLGADALLYYALFVFHAHKDAAPRLLAAALVGVSNAALDFTWAPRWGVAGLAAAHDVAFVLGAALLLSRLHARLGLDLRRVARGGLAAAALATLGGGLARVGVQAWFGVAPGSGMAGQGSLRLLAALLVVLALYGGALRLLRPRTVALWAAALGEAA